MFKDQINLIIQLFDTNFFVDLKSISAASKKKSYINM